MKESFKRGIMRNFTFYINHEARTRTKLLRFQNGREQCGKRLREASEKFKASILNYHISPDALQLLVSGNSTKISNLVKSVAANTAADYRRSHNIEGPFWRKRFKATLVQNGVHLLRCNLTMDMTMVLREKCLYPGEWSLSGHREITEVRKRYRIINCDKAAKLSGFESWSSMKTWYVEHMNAIPAITIFSPDDLIAAVAVGDLEHIESIALCFPKRRREIKLLVSDEFGTTYGLLASQRAKQLFTRSIK
jgi:putative transposase